MFDKAISSADLLCLLLGSDFDDAVGAAESGEADAAAVDTES